MSKKEFVEAYAKATGETKKRAEELVNEFLGTVEEALVNGESVQPTIRGRNYYSS